MAPLQNDAFENTVKLGGGGFDHHWRPNIHSDKIRRVSVNH